MKSEPKPRFVFELYCYGAGDLYCVADGDFPLSRARRLFWKIRGTILQALFGWWWWDVRNA